MSDGIQSDEFDRMWRVVDTLLSGHSTLRDRYRRRERGLTLLVIAFSIVATALAFLTGSSEIVAGSWHISVAQTVGVLTALIFFLALAELVFSWQRLAWSHEDAVRRLSDLKARLRSAKVTGPSALSGGDASDLRHAYEQTMATIIEIPENQFLALKAKHHRKVAVSKLIDSHPGAPVAYLRLLAMFRGLRSRPRTQVQAATEEPVEAPPS